MGEICNHLQNFNTYHKNWQHWLRIARQVDVQLDGWRLATLAAVAVRRKLAQCNSSQEKCKLHLLAAA